MSGAAQSNFALCRYGEATFPSGDPLVLTESLDSLRQAEP
jgi:hypothetical protein